MTPKEKAKELVSKFNDVSIMCGTREVDEEDAVKFIFLCIDEVILELDDIQKMEHHTYERTKYWNDVKREVSLL